MSEPHLPVPGPGEPEYLGAPAHEPGDAPARRGPRWALLGGAAVAVVGAVAVGGWGVAQLMAAGGSPADAVPATAVAYASLDLDPSAGQKIEALRMLKKFPGLADHLDLDARDDVRRWIFEQMEEADGCPGLTYEDDVEPWLGDRFAVAAVPDDDAPLAPLVVVQVTDRDLAATGVRALEDCATGEQSTGLAFVGDYAVLMEEQDDADAFARAAEASPLSDDPGYQDWTGRAGDAGILNAYVSADGPRLMMDAARAESGDAGGDEVDELFGSTRSLYQDFEGAAGVVRFADGTVETELVTRGMPGGLAPQPDPAAPSLAELPATTAAALTVSFPDGWLRRWTDALAGILSADGTGGGEDFWTAVEGETGLRLPEDLETLLGDGLRVSVDGSLDIAGLDGADVPQAPVGVRIHGDETEIVRVLDTLRALVPDGEADALVQRSGEGYVVLGLDPAYVDRLTTDPSTGSGGPGGLGDEDAFTRVVPEPDRVSGGLYVDFDAQDWAVRLAEQIAPGEPEVQENLAPLDALGVTSWVDDDDVQHGLLRLSTD